jgi:hypothetical protein
MLDPRVVKECETILLKQLDYHKIPSKIEELKEIAHEGKLTTEEEKKYKKLDRLITVGMLHAEKSVSRKVSKTYMWSPALSRVIHGLSYWKL